MIIFVSLLGFVSCSILISIVLKVLFHKRLTLLSRLDDIKEEKIINDKIDELNTPFSDRIIRPILDSISRLISKAMPGGIKARISQRLVMAGNPFNIGINGWLLLKIFFVLVLPLILWTSVAMTDILLTKKAVLLLLVLTIMAYFFPNLLIVHFTKKRQKKIVNSLPDVLDLITVSVEAGLSFDGALSRLIDKMEGDLPKEFGRVLNEIKMGKNRREALRDMSTRCGVADLTSFIGSIVQAEELGVGITKVLRIQSRQMRIKRRQRAQEKAMKAPIKMLFPLIIFIFPAIFTVILGPAVIRIIEQLGK